MILIGVISLVASILLLLLPETMATKLPDTIEEVEDNNRADDSDISLRREGELGDLMTEREAQLWVKTRRHRNFVIFLKCYLFFIDILRISLVDINHTKRCVDEHAPNTFYLVCFLFIYLKKNHCYFCKLSLIWKYMYSIYLCVRYFCKIIHVCNYWCSSAVFSKTLSMSCLFPFCKFWMDPTECRKRLLLYKQMSFYGTFSSVRVIFKKDRIGFTKWKM